MERTYTLFFLTFLIDRPQRTQVKWAVRLGAVATASLVRICLAMAARPNPLGGSSCAAAGVTGIVTLVANKYGDQMLQALNVPAEVEVNLCRKRSSEPAPVSLNPRLVNSTLLVDVYWSYTFIGTIS
jgi:hypothetical protein